MPSVAENQLAFYQRNSQPPNTTLAEAEKNYWGPFQTTFQPWEMYSRSDLKREGLKTASGWPAPGGSIADMERAWLLASLGLTNGSINDLWQVADDVGFTSPVVEQLKTEAVLWFDLRAEGQSATKNFLTNFGTLGSVGNAQLGSTASPDTNDPVWLPWTGTNYTQPASAPYPATLVTRPTLLFNTDDYMATPNHAQLNFGANQDFTVYTVVRPWGDPNAVAGYGQLWSKASSTANDPGWNLAFWDRSRNVYLGLNNGHSAQASLPVGDGQLAGVAGRRRGTVIEVVVNGVVSSWDDPTHAANSTNTYPVTQACAATGGFFLNAEWYGSAVFRRALSDSEIQALNNYFTKQASPIDKLRSESLLWFDAKTYSGSGSLINQGSLGNLNSAQLGSTASADTNDPVFLPWTGENYVSLPGIPNSYIAGIPGPSLLAATGDIDIIYHGEVKGNPYHSFFEMQGNYSTFGWFCRNEFSNFIFNAVPYPVVGISVPPWASHNWWRTTRVAATGVITLYWSDDGQTWTQHLTPVTSGIGPLLNTGVITCAIGINSAKGALWSCMVRSGINGPIVAHWDINRMTDRAGYTDDYGNRWYLSADTTQPQPAIVTRPTFLFATDDYLTSPNHASLNFGTSTNFTLVSAQRSWVSNNYHQFLAKNTGSVGYQLGLWQATFSVFASVGGVLTYSWAVVAGKLAVVVARRTGTSVDIAVDGSFTAPGGNGDASAPTAPFYIGRAEVGNYADMEWFGTAVFNRALSQSEINTVTNYFNTSTPEFKHSLPPADIPGILPPLPPATTQHLWTGPDPVAQADAADYEIGTVFSMVIPVTMYKFRIWNPGTATKLSRQATLWRVSDGFPLVHVNLPNVLPAGWSEYDLPSPIPLGPGIQYIISYSTGSNDYGAIDVPLTSNSHIHFDAPMKYNATPGLMPNQNGNGFYGVDLVYEPVTNGVLLQPGHVGWERYGISLTTYTGPAVYSTPGGVLDGMDFPDGIVINAPNVTVKRSRIKTFGDNGLMARENANDFLMEDVEITSLNPPTQMLDRAFTFEGQGLGVPLRCTARRVYVHATQRGGRYGQNTTFEYVWNRGNINATAAHTTALSTNGGAQNAVTRWCNLATEPGTTASSAISCYPEVGFGGPNINMIFDDNFMESAGTFIMYLNYTPPETPNRNIKVRNNWFGTKYNPLGGIEGVFDGWLADQVGDECTGNKWWDERPTGGGYTNKHGQTVNRTD